jgi:hypothetical protein
MRNLLILTVVASLAAFIGCEQQNAPAPTSETAELAEAPAAADPVAEVEAQTTPLCTLHGAAGSSIDCAIKLATDAEGVSARALQAALTFDSGLADFTGFVGELCLPNQDCVEKAVTAESASIGATGHMLKHSPADQIATTGRVSFIIVNMSNPTAAINEATVGSAATFVTARFNLKSDVRADSPVAVTMGNVVASDDAAREISVRIADATIITGGTVVR